MITYLFREYLYNAVPRVSKQIQMVDKIHFFVFAVNHFKIETVQTATDYKITFAI